MPVKKNHKKLIGLAVLTIISALLLFPIFWMLSVSFRPNGEVLLIPPQWLPKTFTIDAYKRVLTNPNHLRSFLNSYLISLAVTLFTLLLGSFAAYALTRYDFSGKMLIINFLVITQTFPLVLLSIPYFEVIVKLGLYDTKLALILVYLSLSFPFSILMLRSYFAEIPHELEQAAMIDGCSSFQAILYVTMPLSVPALIATGLYTFLLSWNEFLFATVVIESIQNRVVTISIYSLLSEFVTDWAAMMAFSVLACLPVIIVFTLLQKQVVQGIMGGAIK